MGVFDGGGGGVDEIDEVCRNGSEVIAVGVLEDEVGPGGEERHGWDLSVG